MIGRADPAATVKALAALDFTASNVRLAEIKAELQAVTEKAATIRGEVDRLAGELRDWRGPDPEALAAAVMAEVDAVAAVDAFPSKETLTERRQALLASAGALDGREAALREEIRVIEQSDRARILEALEPYLDAVAERQRAAAKVIAEGHAEIAAIGQLTGVHWHPKRLPSRQAVERLLGPDRLLPHANALPVPDSLVRMLVPVTERCAAVAGQLPKFVPPA